MTDDQREKDIDRLIEDIEAEKKARGSGRTTPDSVQADPDDRILEERKAKVSGFRLELDLDGEYGHVPPVAANEAQQEGAALPETPSPAPELPESASDFFPEPQDMQPLIPDEKPDAEDVQPRAKKTKKKGKDRTTWGCVRGILYACIVLVLSVTLAYFLIAGGIDITGLNKSDVLVDVVIPQGASTETIANILKENGIIDQPLIFRLYAKITKADGQFQPGTFSLTPNMGYQLLIDTMKNAKPREVVTVVIPEGFTLNMIAERLEENGVCSRADFFRAANNVTYEYEFLQDLPTDEERIYPLEGYLFPDTYEFYTQSSGETVVRKFLDNFNTRVDVSLKSAIKARGMTIDEAIILASIIQGEAADTENMNKVSRVLQNRLENPETYPRLQCDSTRLYAQNMVPGEGGGAVFVKAYDTYERNGLPVGPINNPGLDAIRAVVEPSEDEEVKQCFYFATAYIDGVPQYFYSKTYEQHKKTCEKYGIGIHA